jgi:uncharacterized protein (DUF924 family)
VSAAAEPWVEDVLAFWYGELTYAQWFHEKSDALDATIRRRFGDLWQRLDAESVPTASDTFDPRALLARILVLDQLPRNMFRGTPQAFASDARALALARLVVERGLDRGMTAEQRLFVYLPFEHSEDAADQATCVRLYEALGNAEWVRYAARHKEIIDRFGRFPHRNAILGRASTAEEIAFLQEPNSAF